MKYKILVLASSRHSTISTCIAAWGNEVNDGVQNIYENHLTVHAMLTPTKIAIWDPQDEVGSDPGTGVPAQLRGQVAQATMPEVGQPGRATGLRTHQHVHYEA